MPKKIVDRSPLRNVVEFETDGGEYRFVRRDADYWLRYEKRGGVYVPTGVVKTRGETPEAMLKAKPAY